MAQASFAAKSGKRLWAGGFDALTVAVLFLVVGVTGEQAGLNLAHWTVLGMLYFAYHFGCLLGREGRTLGKTAMDICVISESGTRLTVGRAFLRAAIRSWPFVFFDTHILELTVGFPPSDALFGSLVLLGMVISELTLLERSATRQTLADRLARSLVVNLPPLQPHRAPAVPMYSATDAEFGSPTKRPPPASDWRKRSNSRSNGRAASAAATLSVVMARRSPKR